MAGITDRVIVGISGGKDSAVTLELCAQHFKHIYGYFMYIVRGLSFQERILKYYEERYGIEIVRIPHFMTSEFYKYGTFRLPDWRVPLVRVNDYRAYFRDKFKTYWIACGERVTDSVIRRAMIKKSGSIDPVQGRFYPIAYWTKRDVMDYIKIKKLQVGEESRILGFSFASLLPTELIKIRHHYPEDYEKIKAMFPQCDAAVRHYEYNPEYYLDHGKLLNDKELWSPNEIEMHKQTQDRV